MTTIRIAALAACVTLTAAAGAQQPSASTAAFGMGGNYTAAARNYDAVAWNPANLALPGTSVASFNLLSVGGATGLDPVDLRMIGQYNGQTIPAETKESWLQLIGAGRERGRADLGASLVALSIKNVAFQVGTSGFVDANLNGDAAELLLFGNAGRTGSVRNFALDSSTASGAAFTTGAASIAVPLPFTLTSSPDETFSLGITGKYVMGNAMMRAADGGSTVTPSGAAVSYAAIEGDGGANLGNGLGVDLGLAWHSGRTTLGLTVQNIYNSFAWDTTKLKTRLGVANLDSASLSSSSVDAPFSSAPASLAAAVAGEKFKPTIGAGLAFDVAESILFTADARVQTGDGIQIGPTSRVGAGLELNRQGAFPIRLGAAKITDGWQAAAGLGIRLGDNHVGISAMQRNVGSARGVGAMVNLIAFY